MIPHGELWTPGDPRNVMIVFPGVARLYFHDGLFIAFSIAGGELFIRAATAIPPVVLDSLDGGSEGARAARLLEADFEALWCRLKKGVTLG